MEPGIPDRDRRATDRRVALDLETVVDNPLRVHDPAGTAIDPGIVDRGHRRAPRAPGQGGFIAAALPGTPGVPVDTATAELDLLPRTDRS